MIANILNAMGACNGPDGKPAHIAEAVCPSIAAIPENTGGRNAAEISTGTVSSANEPMPGGILINPAMAQSVANSAVNVSRFDCIGQPSFFLSVLNTFALLTYSLSGTFTREFAMRAATKR
jgi:hypothetical protein